MSVYYTANEQIFYLRSKGMSVPHSEEALYFLVSCNYDSVINVMGSFFRKPESDMFYEGTSLDEIKQVYYFDVEVKQAIYRAMTHAEGHLRSAIAYFFTAVHPEAGSYLDKKNYRDLSPDEEKLLDSRFNQLLGNVFSDKRNYPISKEYEKDDEIPLDKLIGYFDFAMLRMFYSFIKPKDKFEIWFFFTKYLMDEYQLNVRISDQDVDAIMGSLCELRNLIAHNNQLFNFQCKEQPPFLPQLYYQPSTLIENSRTDVYNTLLLLQPFIEYSQFATLYNGIHKRANQLNNHLKSISINIILPTLGFPENWHLSPKLPQVKPKVAK